MKIVVVPNEVLHDTAKPVTVFDRKLKKLVDDMKVTLLAQRDPEGVGLAAPQIGVAESIFIMKPTKKGPITVVINPLIVNQESGIMNQALKSKIPNTKYEQHSTDESKLEGCLSIPRIWGAVTRDQSIDIRYQTLDGKHVEKTFTGFEAVIVQHEMDHLHGVLFTQRVLEQNGQLYKEINGELEKYEI